MDLSEKAGAALARRSSRRQLLKLLTASSLGAGLFLTRTGATLGAVSTCVGCGGGPCNPCYGAGPRCNALDPPYPCKTCQEAGGCPEGCSTSGEWFCCQTGTACRQRCSECNCPSGCASPHCHCFTLLPIPCTPTLHSGDEPCPCPPLSAPIP